MHDKNGYYLASGRSALLAAQLEGHVLPIESIDKTYNRPDLLLASLPSPDSLLLHLYQKVRLLSNQAGADTNYLPAEEGGALLVTRPVYPLQLRYDPEQKPRSVAVWVNGSAYTPETIQFDDKSGTALLHLALSEGINRLEWQLRQADGSSSLTATRHVYLPRSGQQKISFTFLEWALPAIRTAAIRSGTAPRISGMCWLPWQQILPTSWWWIR
ncbi:hypothetical protein [Cesiribacter andamanensis]|uniref:hypothetical protein n=1 Tax=Cesiribacter andamanensis TaxID=649507 RepID=UPI000345D109|nr:hypothetical protein [Cesiribacter andamanensis]